MKGHIMKNKKQTFDHIVSMSIYGIRLGCLVGFFGTSVAIFSEVNANMPSLGATVSLAFVGGIFGILLGMFYGAVAGFSSGFMMMCLTRILFREIRRPKIYKLAMGMTTAISTGIIFIYSPMWFLIIYTRSIPSPTRSPHLFQDAWFILWAMSLVFAVYASQRVANKYLKHIAIGKVK